MSAMPEERLVYLVDRYLNHCLSKEEQHELEAYGSEHPELWRLISVLEDPERIKKDLDGWQDPIPRSSIAPGNHKLLIRNPAFWKWAAVIAGPLLMLWVTVTFVRNRQGKALMAKASPAWQTRSTARDGQLALNLPDGSRVWLSNASTLSYPAVFGKNGREVKLSGEALFEIARDPSRPFNIRARDCRIEILGTRLDIMAYPDENEISTSLLSGNVAVHRGDKEQRLQPGQQLILRPDDEWRLESGIDPDAVMSWKNGYFYFKRTPIPVVIRRLSRYYGVPIDIRGPIDRTCNATLKMGLSLPLILEKLGLTVTYERNRLTVSE